MNYRSDILHLRPGRKLSGKRLSPHGRSGRRRAASRNQGNWVAAIAGAMTWLRVSSSGGIGDAASVSVNAMGRRPGRGRRRSRNSSNTTSDEWPGSKGLGPFRLWLGLPTSPYLWGHSLQDAEIARDCAVICRFGGTGRLARGITRQPLLARLQQVLLPAIIQVLVDALPAA
jgi:hypothetical protein